MSQRAFQASLARLALEPDFREQVRSQGEPALGPRLTPLERKRLAAAAADPGLDLTAYLIRSFRLGKLLTLLPLTRTLLGSELLASEARSFWRAHPPTSFYFLEEALAFCNHLLERTQDGLRVAYLDEVVAYERAMLELRRVRSDGDRPQAQVIHFRHDPVRLLEALAAGKRPGRVPAASYDLVGVLDEDGEIRWSRATQGRLALPP